MLSLIIGGGLQLVGGTILLVWGGAILWAPHFVEKNNLLRAEHAMSARKRRAAGWSLVIVGGLNGVAGILDVFGLW